MTTARRTIPYHTIPYHTSPYHTSPCVRLHFVYVSIPIKIYSLLKTAYSRNVHGPPPTVLFMGDCKTFFGFVAQRRPMLGLIPRAKTRLFHCSHFSGFTAT